MAFPDAIVIGDVVAGHLRVVREIARGGMGILYEVEDTSLRRRAALKVMTGELAHDPVLRDRLVREARAVAQLRSPHAVTVFDIGTLPDGAPFVVMELLEGETVEAVLERDGPLAVDVAIDWLVQALEAVVEAHRLGLVHRDLKPSNMFVTRSPSGVVVKVLDFGLVADRAADARLTQTGEQLGTPVYMAPEQVMGARDVDARADVWAAGVTLYEMLSRRVPFEQASVPALFRAITAGEAVPIEARRPGVPRAVASVVDRCLARDRSARFPDAAALRDALVLARRALAVADASPPTVDEARGAREATPTRAGPAARPAPDGRGHRGKRGRRPVFVLAAAATLVAGALLLFAGLRILGWRSEADLPRSVASARAVAAPSAPPPASSALPVAAAAATSTAPVTAGPEVVPSPAVVARAPASASPRMRVFVARRHCVCATLTRPYTAATYDLCPVHAMPIQHEGCACENENGRLTRSVEGIEREDVFASAGGFGGEPCEGNWKGQRAKGIVTCEACGRYDAYEGHDDKPCTGLDGRGRTVKEGRLVCPP